MAGSSKGSSITPSSNQHNVGFQSIEEAEQSMVAERSMDSNHSHSIRAPLNTVHRVTHPTSAQTSISSQLQGERRIERSPWQMQSQTEAEANREAIRRLLAQDNPYNLRRRPAQPSQSPDRRNDLFGLPDALLPTSQDQEPAIEADIPFPTPRSSHGSNNRRDFQGRDRDEEGQHGQPRLTNGRRKRTARESVDEDWEEKSTKSRRTQGTHKAIAGVQQEGNPEEKTCEFSSPCRMNPSPDGMHWRKVVSHIFGRNKASTKLFPDFVWVHYCRKHYQRARYRADQWPFTQCELLLESLTRMEEWGGVESFHLTLRRREKHRNRNEAPSSAATQKRLQSGRKHPTAIIAPVPDWLRQELGKNKSFAEIRRIVERVREYMVALRGEEKAQLVQNDVVAGNSRQSGTSEPRRYYRSGTWHPVNPEANTPRASASSSNEPLRSQMSRVRFPDVEILPAFHSWVYDEENRRRGQAQAAARQGASEAMAFEPEGEIDEHYHDESDGQREEEYRAHNERGGLGSYREAMANGRRARCTQNTPDYVSRVSSRGAVKKPNAEK